MTWPEYLAGRCRIDGRLTSMRPCETELLCVLLLSSPDRFAPLGDLVERLWLNPDDEPEALRTWLSVYMTRLRRRGITIQNDHGRGWRIPRNARGREQVKLAA